MHFSREFLCTRIGTYSYIWRYANKAQMVFVITVISIPLYSSVSWNRKKIFNNFSCRYRPCTVRWILLLKLPIIQAILQFLNIIWGFRIGFDFYTEWQDEFGDHGVERYTSTKSLSSSGEDKSGKIAETIYIYMYTGLF